MTHLDAAREDIPAFAVFAREIWRQIWSNNPAGTARREVAISYTISERRGPPGSPDDGYLVREL